LLAYDEVLAIAVGPEHGLMDAGHRSNASLGRIATRFFGASMPHIQLAETDPGIIGPLRAYPETERPLDDFCNALLCGPSSLTRAERELIATYVSHGNECYFCTNAHAAATRCLFGDKANVVDEVLGGSTQSVDRKMQCLLTIADKVRRDGRLVTADDIQAARNAGADDKAIHDTVLIAAAFCMFNRYVDGLATWAPKDPALYAEIGTRIATKGYGSRFREAADEPVELPHG
jgi:uncharacterized peroxidase-related enzyme